MTVTPVKPVQNPTPTNPMKNSTQILSALFLGVLTATAIVVHGQACAESLATLTTPAAIAAAAPEAPTVSDEAADQAAAEAAAEAEAAALAANPVSNSFATDANGDLVNTKQAVMRTRLPDGGSLVSITILTDRRAN